MPIKFRCQFCNQLMSIATRKAGTMTVCPKCASDIEVPFPEQQKNPEQENPEQVTAPEQKGKPSRVQSPSESPLPPPVEETEESQFEKNSNATTQTSDTGKFSLAQMPVEANEEELEFELRKAATDFDDLDMTPMVDVTFLLLIFFMVTASFSIQKSIEVPPPNPDQQGAAQTVQPLEELEENAILVEIDAENRFFVESEPVPDPRDLPTVLAEVRSRESKNEIVVSVDERTRHEAVVNAIDAAQEVGMQRIRWGVNPAE